jgi:plasmid maintenance system antidote protein VapI
MQRAEKNPPHPGKHVRVTCLEPTGLTVTAAARALGISRQALNNVVN